MSKATGLGDYFLFGGYAIGGDIQQLDLHGGPKLLDVTDITQSAHSRLGGLRDAQIALTAYMNPSAGQEHAAFSPLTTADIIATYLRGQAIGNPALSQVSRQLNYDPVRGTDGSLTEKVNADSDAFGQEWGVQLTAGVRADTGATNGAQFDNSAGQSNGAQAYLHAVSFTGTDVTVTIQHSTTSGSGFTTLVAFTQITGGTPLAQRVTVAGTVNRYLRVITTTSGGFSAFSFACMVAVNTLAVAF